VKKPAQHYLALKYAATAADSGDYFEVDDEHT